MSDDIKLAEFLAKVRALEEEYGVQLQAAIRSEHLLAINQQALAINEHLMTLIKAFSQVPVEIGLRLPSE